MFTEGTEALTHEGIEGETSLRACVPLSLRAFHSFV